MVKEESESKVTEVPKKKTSQVELTQVATQMGEAFKLPSGEVVSMYEYLVWLGNLVNETRIIIGGKV